jgi:hypothetical protein
MAFAPARAADLVELEPPSEEETARLEGLTLPALPY